MPHMVVGLSYLRTACTFLGSILTSSSALMIKSRYLVDLVSNSDFVMSRYNPASLTQP